MTVYGSEITVSKERIGLLSAVLAAGFVLLTAWGMDRPIGGGDMGRFFLLVLVGAVAHEGLHALGWMMAGRVPLRSFRFGVAWRYGILYAHCDAAMPMAAYRFGSVLPGVLTGVAPWLAGGLLGDRPLALAGALLTAGATGDGAVLWASRGVPGGAPVEDHPTEVGLHVLPGDRAGAAGEGSS